MRLFRYRMWRPQATSSDRLSVGGQSLDAFLFGVRKQWRTVLLLVCMSLVAVSIQECAFLGSWSKPESAKSAAAFLALWTRLDPLFTLLTLGAAVLVWFSEIQRNWESSLPVYLTAQFLLKQEVMLRCERALLLDESPRAWGQQLGRQMNGNENLELSPDIHAEPPCIEWYDGKWVKHVTVHFQLLKSPVKVAAEGSPLVWNRKNQFGQALLSESLALQLPD